MKTATTTRIVLLSAIATLLLAFGASAASAAPVFYLGTHANSTAAQDSAFRYGVVTNNVGDEAAFGIEKLIATLPTGVTAVAATNINGSAWSCKGDAPGEAIAGASVLTCVTEPLFFGTGVFGATGLAIEVEAGSLPEGAVPLAHFDLYFESFGAPPTLPDGTPCGSEPPQTPCASTVDPTTIASAEPSFGIEGFDMAIVRADGSPDNQAGAHPYSQSVYIDLNSSTNPNIDPGTESTTGQEEAWPVQPARDILAELPPGFIGDVTAIPQCEIDELAAPNGLPLCPSASQVGTTTVRVNGLQGASLGPLTGPIAVYNMVPPPGAAARLGFDVAGTVVSVDIVLRRGGDYGIDGVARNISEGLSVTGSDLTLWGDPADESHRALRSCPGEVIPIVGGPTCAGAGSAVAFLRNPTSCGPAGEGLRTRLHADSYHDPASFNPDGSPDLADPNWKSVSADTHEAPGFPHLPSEWGEEVGMEGCEDVPVKGTLSASPTARETETPSGLQVHVAVPNPGIKNSEGISASDIKAVKVALPAGVTINPSQAEGLGVCSQAQYESSELSFVPGVDTGCPSDSKVGTVEVHTPLLSETIPGSVYVAKPFDNPFDSLLAIYVVLKEPQRGILVKLAGELRTNETTGQIEAEFKDLPQQPFSSFDFKFREGARAPLATPPTCGTYTTETTFTPWSDPSHTIVSKSSFTIDKGIGGGPCPSGGVPAFHPLFSAGSINNNAGSYSPFDMRITRSDGEQDMTRFSAVLPPGVLGKLAGLSKCPDAAIAAAKAKTGLQEIASPSCPASSEIGRSLAGAGVGSVLTYVPGKLYLGGPFHGDPLSVIAITPAVAGPFDVGTVVVHEALTLNPKTAEVEVDGAASDPIPHILKGIPLKLRDLRVYVDRQSFILNPTSCDESATEATLFGGGGNAFTSADDVPVALSDRYQAASCQSLGFKPGLALNLKGGTRRGAHPALAATYKPRAGDANVKGLVVRLPRSAFLEQAHIRTVCTRVQFAAKACPPGARYGFIRAWTPLLDEPLEGPVYLRSSDHKLPDLVFDLHGLVDVEVATRIDSVHGGIRATVQDAPDAPLSKVLLKMQGAKKGLIVNSRNLCGSTNRASVAFSGQNGKQADATPVLKPGCGGKRGRKRR